MSDGSEDVAEHTPQFESPPIYSLCLGRPDLRFAKQAPGSRFAEKTGLMTPGDQVLITAKALERRIGAFAPPAVDEVEDRVSSQ